MAKINDIQNIIKQAAAKNNNSVYVENCNTALQPQISGTDHTVTDQYVKSGYKHGANSNVTNHTGHAATGIKIMDPCKFERRA